MVSISFLMTLAAWSQPSLQHLCLWATRYYRNMTETERVCWFQPCREVVCPRLWLGMGQGSEGCRTWRCSHGQHCCFRRDTESQSYKWHGQQCLISEWMPMVQGDWISQPQNPLLACYPPDTNWLYFIKDFNCKLHVLEETVMWLFLILYHDL